MPDRMQVPAFYARSCLLRLPSSPIVVDFQYIALDRLRYLREEWRQIQGEDGKKRAGEADASDSEDRQMAARPVHLRARGVDRLGLSVAARTRQGCFKLYGEDRLLERVPCRPRS